MQYLIVFSTAPNKKIAAKIAHSLVRRKMAACVNILPGVESCFWWKGKIDKASEVLLVIKTFRSRFRTLCSVLRALHPYKVPEIIGAPLVEGSKSYLEWMQHSLTMPGR